MKLQDRRGTMYERLPSGQLINLSNPRPRKRKKQRVKERRLAKEEY